VGRRRLACPTPPVYILYMSTFGFSHASSRRSSFLSLTHSQTHAQTHARAHTHVPPRLLPVTGFHIIPLLVAFYLDAYQSSRRSRPASTARPLSRTASSSGRSYERVPTRAPRFRSPSLRPPSCNQQGSTIVSTLSPRLRRHCIFASPLSALRLTMGSTLRRRTRL
jgi:hypothetical protein